MEERSRQAENEQGLGAGLGAGFPEESGGVKDLETLARPGILGLWKALDNWVNLELAKMDAEHEDWRNHS